MSSNAYASHARLIVAGSEDTELPDGCYLVDRAVAKKVYMCVIVCIQRTDAVFVAID